MRAALVSKWLAFALSDASLATFMDSPRRVATAPLVSRYSALLTVAFECAWQWLLGANEFGTKRELSYLF